jgi:fructoselysine-6-P-deglycase FrlB-like protein
MCENGTVSFFLPLTFPHSGESKDVIEAAEAVRKVQACAERNIIG